MRGNELLDKMALVDAAFVEEADRGTANRRHRWRKWGTMAACFCLAAVGAFSLWNANRSHQPEAPLEKICIPELRAGGMGFEGYLYYDAMEIENDNPWNEAMEIATLPVYRNKAYDSSGVGIPKGWSEEEMRAALEAAAAALKSNVISTEVMTEQNPVEGAAEKVFTTEIHATTENGELSVSADGCITYVLPEDGFGLPGEYHFSNTDTSADEARRAIAYLFDCYSDLLNMRKPTAVTWGEYDIYGTYYRRYAVYASGRNDAQNIQNYNLCRAVFYPNVEGRLWMIRIYNDLALAEKLGDYPIISEGEARQRLFAGNYQTSVPYAMPGEKYVAKAEMVYRTGRLEEMLLPYYRYYVLLPELQQENGLQTYGAYYVPAIADEYIADMPVYDGQFN